ncbi:MAG: pilus assembly protein TadG-related protein [Gemmataceae bacterium]
MRPKIYRTARIGTILPYLVITIVALCGFTALAVDVGMIMVAKAELQTAADAAAFAGARALDGSPSANLAGATAAAVNSATSNNDLGVAIRAPEVTVTHGAYHYDYNTAVFSPQFPPVAPDNYNLTQVTIVHDVPLGFAKVWNLFTTRVSVTAIAAHRPRDVCIILDYSGSMNNESDVWNCESYLGTANNSPNNADPIFPKFGPYDPTASPLATLQCTSTDPRVGKCNTTQAVLGIPAMVDDFYQSPLGVSPGVKAFALPPPSVTVTTPGGDNYLPKSGTSTPAKNWAEVRGNTLATFAGYSAYTGKAFKGWTQGPGYWGKTFFIWPPDPTYDANNVPWDWRKRYFKNSAGTAGLNDNTKLFNASGNPSGLNAPPNNYQINYKAILAWISANCKQVTAGDGNPFPPTLRAGGILYYDQIPTDVPSAAYTHTNANNQIADPNQRFWKEYIDFVIGVWRDPYGNVQAPGNPACSYGPDYTCCSASNGTGVSISGPNASYLDSQGVPFVSPTDNPLRPRHRFWFGPMTMVQFMSDTGLLPGTAHDISMVAAKLGIHAALEDISMNHPNDLVSLLMFSRPHYGSEPPDAGQFSAPLFNLSRDYAGMIRSLYFPPNSVLADVRPWDANDHYTPRAHGDYTGNTATGYGFREAYNQFSSSSVLRSTAVGGTGRKGAQRLVILETDGMANVATSAAFNANGTSSYYQLPPTFNVNTSGIGAGQDAIDIATRICSLTTDNTNGPGFSTPNKPVIIHCVAFGAVFEPTAQGSEPANALSFLGTISDIGGTGFPTSLTDTSDPNYYKLCTGTLQQRQDKLRQAFSKIMNEGVSIVMVK